MELPAEIAQALTQLNAAGYDAFVVGGSVRDSLLGKRPYDFDITTDALPEQVKACFAGERVVETGIAHGTVTVVLHGMPIEITTYRIDGSYRDNRHPDSVCFTPCLEEDLKRRDFTINALCYHPETGIRDLFCGVADLEKKLIRCVGEARQRFEEDALRILRALRFASVLGFEIEEQTKAAIFEKKELLLRIAAERVQVELSKLLCGRDAQRILMHYRDVIAVVVPEISAMFDFAQHSRYHDLDVWAHTCKALGYIRPDLTLRLCMLFHDIGKPACFTIDEEGAGHFYGHAELSAQMCQKILRRLKYDVKTIKTVTSLVEVHDGYVRMSEVNIRRWLMQIGEERLRLLLEVQEADSYAHAPFCVAQRLSQIQTIRTMLEAVLEQKQCYSLKQLAVNGRDMLEIGFAAGRQVGHALDALLDAVIAGRLENDREALLAAARHIYEEKEGTK